jgi:hypothetical protein
LFKISTHWRAGTKSKHWYRTISQNNFKFPCHE